MLKAKLLVVGGDAKQAEINLKTFPTVIGRGRDVTLTLPHPLVSRQHCEIFEKNGRLHIRDLESLNGTYLNNVRIKGEHVFEPGQLLTLGNVTFRADYQIVGNETSDVHSQLTSALTECQKRAQLSNEKTETSFSKRKTCHENSRPDKETVHQDDLESVASAAAEAVDSNIFVRDESGCVLHQDSVSLSSIDGLPESQPMVSFVGGVNSYEDNAPGPIDLETVQIETGDESRGDMAGDSSLDSFVRKLPK